MAKSIAEKQDAEPIKCGVIMPISAMGDCSESHWGEVLTIVGDAVEGLGFQADLVSNADEVTVIQKTIVQNIYKCPVVICDVSEKNANVMFELGMRLAFDKPTVIIKDDRTSYSFDTSIIEHIEYPRDLRFSKIVKFKIELAKKVKATWEKSKKDGSSSFLSHFGEFKVAQLDEKEVSSDAYIIEQLQMLHTKINRIDMRNREIRVGGRVVNRDFHQKTNDERIIDLCMEDHSVRTTDQLVNFLGHSSYVTNVFSSRVGDHMHIRVEVIGEDYQEWSSNRAKVMEIFNRFENEKNISSED